MIFRLLTLVFVSTFLSGCLGWHQVDLKKTQVSATTAKHRLVYSKPVEPDNTGAVKVFEVICMEPSPDVATASQSALQIVANAADGTKAQISASTAEALASLVERTATIQLLRDQMFRACEAYSNGAISATSYSLVMSRNNKAMITLMLGETAAGAFGRSGVALGGKTSASGSLGDEGSSETFEASLAKLVEIDSDVDAARTARDSAKSANDEANKDDSKATDEQKDELSNNLKTAEKNLKDLENKKANALVLVQSSHNQTANSAAEIVESEGFGSLTASVSANAIDALSQMQEIYMRDSLADEVISACVVEMGFSLSEYAANRFNEPLINSLEPIAADLQKKGAAGALSASDFEDAKKQARNIESSLARHSALTQFCIKNLPSMINHAEANRQTNVKRHYGLKQATIKHKALTICDRLDSETSKNSCMKNIGIDFPKKEKAVDISKFSEYVAISELLVSIESLKADIKEAHEKLHKLSLIIPPDNKYPHCAADEKDKDTLERCKLLDDSAESVVDKALVKAKSGRKDFPATPALDKTLGDAEEYTAEYAKAVLKTGGEIKKEELASWKNRHSEIQGDLKYHMNSLEALQKKLGEILDSIKG